MSTRFTFLAVLVFAAAAFSQTSVQPADWMTLQTSGKTLLLEMRDVSHTVRVTIMDLRGRPVWTSTSTPVNGAVTVAWNGTASDGSTLAGGVYVMRVVSLQAGRTTPLMRRSITHSI
jgi:flagellar hook assembly protein FlgD